ncbi:hypothetical protein HK405_013038, partial [Cladochytrium tenue]
MSTNAAVPTAGAGDFSSAVDDAVSPSAAAGVDDEGHFKTTATAALPLHWHPSAQTVSLQGEVDATYAFVPMLVCCLGTGLTDATLFNVYGSFVSMQTGNTVFIALGTLGGGTYTWARSLCSLLFFVFGSFFFARFHLLLGGARLKRTLVSSFLLQTLCVVVASAIIQSGAVDGHYPTSIASDTVNWGELVAIALLSFQAAGQIVNSRGLGLGEVPTVVITSLLCDLVSDPKVFARIAENPKRNRRALGFLLTLAGAICGGWLSKGTSSVQASLWLVAGIKLAIS